MEEAFTDDRILAEHRSYDADEVDAFLVQIREGVARLKSETLAALDRAATAEEALARTDEERTALLGGKVITTQQALDRALADARREAADIVSEAQARADRLLTTAQAQAELTAADPPGSSDNLFADLRRSLAAGAGLDAPVGSHADEMAPDEMAPAGPSHPIQPAIVPLGRQPLRRRSSVTVGALTSYLNRRRRKVNRSRFPGE